jgi:hypothetical protein
MTTPEEDGTSARSAAEAPLPGVTAATEAAATEAPAAPATAAGGAAPTVTPARPHRANSVTALLVVSALVAAGGVGYAVGHATGQTGTSQTIGGQNGQNGQNAPNGQNGLPAIGPNASGVPVLPGGQNADAASAAGAVSGTVVSVTPSSITIRLPNGRTVTIPTGSSTVFSVQEPATSSDVTVGATVIVRTSDGTGAASASAGMATQVIITGK